MKRIWEKIKSRFGKAPLTHPSEIYDRDPVLQKKIGERKVRRQRLVNWYGIEKID